MNKERFFRVIGQVDDHVIERYYEMDERLARKQITKRHLARVLMIAACAVLVLVLSLPLAALSHPAGRAVLRGDYEALAEQLAQIEGFEQWQEQTAQKLEQVLPESVYEIVLDSPIFHTLLIPRFSALGAADSFEDGNPYHLYFISNGDGTCTLKYVTVDPTFEGDFVIEIPETSFAGDTVTAIDLGQVSGTKSTQYTDFPYILTASSMEALCKAAQISDMSGFDYKRMLACYLKLSVAGLDANSCRELLAAYPIVAFGDIYIFDLGATEKQIEGVYGCLTKYCGWDKEMYQKNVDELVSMAKRSDNREQAELCLTILRDADLRGVVGISIPKTVISIHGDTWLALSELETVTVAQDHPTFEVIDNCLIDTATGTLKRCLAEGGKIPENAGILTIDAYAFAGCTPTHTVEGGQMIFHLYIPESVIEVRPDGFSGISDVNSIAQFRIHLPAGLRSFGSNPSNPVYYYAGTAQEWNDNVRMVSVRKNDYIYLYTTDAEQAVKVTFGE